MGNWTNEEIHNIKITDFQKESSIQPSTRSLNSSLQDFLVKVAPSVSNTEYGWSTTFLFNRLAPLSNNHSAHIQSQALESSYGIKALH